MPKTTKKPTRAASTKTKPKKKAVPEFAKPFYKKRWFAIFALILVFSAIGGGYMIRRGDAATYTFIRRTPQMAGNGPINKEDGQSYKHIGDGIRTWVTASETRNTREVCFHYKNTGFITGAPDYGNTTIFPNHATIEVDGGAIRHKALVDLGNQYKTGNACTRMPATIRGKDVEVRLQLSGGGGFIVDTIYGKL